LRDELLEIYAAGYMDKPISFWRRLYYFFFFDLETSISESLYLKKSELNVIEVN
jgi:hypothetical protein